LHAFTRPSSQLVLKVRDALLRTIHHSSLYMRLIIANKEKGARTNTVIQALHKKLTHSPWKGTSLLKFIYKQLYNGKLAMRYGHALIDECPRCHMPDSCTHIAGECQDHEALRISRHNAACQLVHAAIRKTAKGGWALHSAPGLVLDMADTGTQPMTTGNSIKSLPPHLGGHQPIPDHGDPPHDWFAPLPTSEDIRRRRHTDVSQDPKYNHSGLSAADGDAECTAAPRRILDWFLPQGKTHIPFEAGHGKAPYLIYARGVPDTPSPNQTSFDKNKCTLIIVEIGFRMDLGCDIKFEKKNEKYSPLLANLKR